jgi:hypothetical protein
MKSDISLIIPPLHWPESSLPGMVELVGPIPIPGFSICPFSIMPGGWLLLMLMPESPLITWLWPGCLVVVLMEFCCLASLEGSNMPSELIPYTFKDTGISIKIKKVSPLLIVEMHKYFPPPKPPMQEVVYGDPGEPGAKTVEEPNESHPDYLAAIDQYNIDLESKMRELMIKRGVVINLSDEQKQEVQELREDWEEMYGNQLSGNDKYVFISYIAIGTDKDMEEVIEAITRRSQPTEAAIAETKAGFQSEV